jgi:predicted ATPase
MMGAVQVVGRDGELAILTALARDAAAGRGRLVLIEGEPGIGKTSLLQAFLEDAAGLLPRVVVGAAEEFDQRLPFATVGSCLERLAAGDPLVAEVLALIRGAGAEYPVIESVPGGQHGAQRGGGRLHPAGLDMAHLVRQGMQSFR